MLFFEASLSLASFLPRVRRTERAHTRRRVDGLRLAWRASCPTFRLQRLHFPGTAPPRGVRRCSSRGVKHRTCCSACRLWRRLACGSQPARIAGVIRKTPWRARRPSQERYEMRARKPPREQACSAAAESSQNARRTWARPPRCVPGKRHRGGCDCVSYAQPWLETNAWQNILLPAI